MNALDTPVNNRISQARLYGIIDLGYIDPENVLAATAALCAGGADVLQLRAKGMPHEEILRLAQLVAPLVKAAGIPFIINDFADIAVTVEADGVHIGQEDGNLADVRRIVGNEMLVGRSTHSPEQARAALAEGFDYIGFGPLFPTPTKQGRPGIGLENVIAVERDVGSVIPVFCIGGITFETLPTVIAAGARRVVIVSAILRQADIAAAVRQAKEMLAPA